MTSSTLSAKEAWSRSLLSFFIRSNQRLIATSDHIASTIPNGHAPWSDTWTVIFLSRAFRLEAMALSGHSSG